LDGESAIEHIKVHFYAVFIDCEYEYDNWEQ